MQATQTFITMPLPSVQIIRGEVSDATSRYGIHLNWNGSSMEGRLGGWWFAEKISLERSPHGLIGYVTSRSVHLTVNVTLVDARLELLIASRGCTETMNLELSDGSTGIWHGCSGQPTPIQLVQTAAGVKVLAAERRVTLDSPSDWVAVSAALVSLAAQRAVSSAMLESLRAMREQ